VVGFQIETAEAYYRRGDGLIYDLQDNIYLTTDFHGLTRIKLKTRPDNIF
jgi:hypothetical protein